MHHKGKPKHDCQKTTMSSNPALCSPLSSTHLHISILYTTNNSIVSPPPLPSPSSPLGIYKTHSLPTHHMFYPITPPYTQTHLQHNTNVKMCNHTTTPTSSNLCILLAGSPRYLCSACYQSLQWNPYYKYWFCNSCRRAMNPCL
jgi:hypothetical protein